MSLVGLKKAAVHPGKHGYPAEVDIELGGVGAKDFDGIVVPGDFSPDCMRRDPRFAGKLVRQGQLGGQSAKRLTEIEERPCEATKELGMRGGR